jgi:hypothetical protein
MSTVNTPRDQVYAAIDSERDYQEEVWGASLSSDQPGNGDRTLDEFALYIGGYADDLTRVSSHSGSPQAKLEVVRKVAALCVAAMEQHGAPHR